MDQLSLSTTSSLLEVVKAGVNMFTSIFLDRFKPFASPQRGRLAPITLIYGPNSSGKTSLIQSLMLLRQSVTSGNNTESFNLNPRVEDGIDLGIFQSLSHGQNLRNTVRLGVGFHSSDSDSSRTFRRSRVFDDFGRYLDAHEKYLEMGFRAAASPNTDSRKLVSSLLRELKYEFSSMDGLRLRLNFTPSSRRTLELDSESFESLNEFVDGFGEHYFHDKEIGEDTGTHSAVSRHIRPRSIRSFMQPAFEYLRNYVHLQEHARTMYGYGGLPGGIELPSVSTKGMSRREQADQYRTLDIANGVISAPLLGVKDAFFRNLSDIDYIGPLRKYPERLYIKNYGQRITDVGPSGENTAYLLDQGGAEVEEIVNSWFDKFEINYRLSVGRAETSDPSLGEILVVNVIPNGLSDISVSLKDVGFGISQILPVIVQGVIKRSGTLLVEQPEIHLHPRLQANIADFMIDRAGLTGKNRSHDSQSSHLQWIVETHSEMIILRILKRIREKAISKNDVSVLYVDQNNEGESKIIDLRIDDEGEFFDEWPDGFFEESFDELV